MDFFERVAALLLTLQKVTSQSRVLLHLYHTLRAFVYTFRHPLFRYSTSTWGAECCHELFVKTQSPDLNVRNAASSLIYAFMKVSARYFVCSYALGEPRGDGRVC